MTQKMFQMYNTLYADYAGRIVEYERANTHGQFAIEHATLIKGWMERVTQWPQHLVQHAVYGHPTHKDWQKFRVSLKGFNTKEKLYRLRYRLAMVKKMGTQEEQNLEQIRIDNYIGALVRGGQLNNKLEVAR